MSSINTNNINVNYPVPGINNSTQGFRDNFTSIKTNLNTAGTEITDLQNKVVLKAALDGETLNNDMANTLISNATTRSFRASTYNLGNNVQGTTTINVSQGDVQYGTITANTTFNFGGWAPVGTQSNVELFLTIANSSAFITFPTTTNDGSNIPTVGLSYTAFQLENYVSNTTPTPGNTYTNQVSIPAGVTQVNYLISTTNCGTLMDIYPINRPKKSTAIINGTPVVTNVAATNTITAATNSTTVTGSGTIFLTELVAGRVILNSSNVVIGTVSSISSNTSLTLTANANVAVSGAAYHRQLPIGSPGDVTGTIETDGTYIYLCTANYDGTTAIWKRVTPSSY
jgi:hypothetical protein